MDTATTVDLTSTQEMNVSPSVSTQLDTVTTTAEPILNHLRLPPSEDIHTHPQMPSWIQDIYSKLSEHASHLQTHSSKIDEIQDLLHRNRELQLALDQANLRIAELEAAAKTHPLSSAVPATPPQVGPSTTSASKWADMAAATPTSTSNKPAKSKSTTTKTKSTDQPASQPKKKRPLTLEQLDRFYSLPSGNQGYQFLYFTTRGRERISKIRAGFEVLGLSQSRILDIHYPENQTIGFLVHNDYASAVIEGMSKLPSSKLLPDFDPCASNLLRDPKYTNITDSSFLQTEAVRIHQDRLTRIVQRIHNPHVQLAVAREFCFKRKWLPEATYKELYYDIHPDKTPKAPSSSPRDDVAMNDASDNTDSSNPISPADGDSAPLA
ncbi:hypothetical protein HMPREF1544_11354 [Mucor circinelloides 1006PhL]|uniref:Uncharacterized protein n=2 Tax=Mucor circinelloides f. circinelloides (strain 1006PhL) TaxID=1220926 RepID=S2JHE9_MUCC1|nr:hypothetical protein HMPREF1544_11354 [Mucor circinelloides 1006PhL]